MTHLPVHRCQQAGFRVHPAATVTNRPMGARTGWSTLSEWCCHHHIGNVTSGLGSKQMQNFLMGLQVITDHNPLISILHEHCLDEVDNLTLQQLKTKPIAFSVTAKWCKGDTKRAPDALSCYPVREPHQSDSLARYDEEKLPELSAAIVHKDNHIKVQMQ